MNPTPAWPPTVADWLRPHDARATAIVFGERALSYGELSERVDATASALAAAGYGRGSRIATVTRNHPDHVVLLFACAAIGAALVPLSWRLTAPELAAQLATADADLVISGEPGIPTGERVTALLGDAPPPSPRPLAAASAEDDDPLLLVFTSGTAGPARAAVLTHANARATAASLHGLVPLCVGDVVLGVLPQFHAAGWNTQPLLALAVGATLVLEPDFDPGRALGLIQHHGVTAAMGVPTTWALVARHPAFGTTRIDTLRHAVVGGAAASADLLGRWAARGVTLRQGYGLTEASPNVLCQTAAQAAAAPGGCGSPYPGVEVRLVDAASATVVIGAGRGELQVAGPGVFAGYFRDPEATARAHDGDWLRTGDLAERQADGTYRIVDRIKDIFVSGGENVAPAEVEAALAAHPAVHEVAVTAVADETWGEVGVAWVVADPGLTAENLLADAATRLARFKLPRRVEFVSELPRSGVGKVLRRALAADRQETP